MSALAAGLDGFLLGGSLIVAIGAQNAFVLRQGLKREFVFAVCLICSLADAVLITAGVAGLGTLVRQSPTALMVVTGGGAIFLFVYGVRSFLRALRPEAMLAEGRAGTLSAAIAACLAFTFLNPHVYLDTVLLLGSLVGALRRQRCAWPTASARRWRPSRGSSGSATARGCLAPLFAKPRAWQVLDIAIGLVMWWLAARLAISLIALRMSSL